MSSFSADTVPALATFEPNPLFGEESNFISQNELAASSLEGRLAAAFEEGREAGRAELPWNEAGVLSTAAGALASAGEALALIQRDGLRSQRVAIVDLGLTIARHLLAREIEADPDALVAQVSDALELVQGHAPPVVYLSQADHETLRGGGAPGLERLVGDWGATLEADPELARGQARVEGGESLIELELDRALARIRAELLATHGGGE